MDKIARQLWDITMESGQDDEVGDVNELGWYALILDSGIDGANHAIVSQDGQGFVDYEVFSSARSARLAWEEIQEKYATDEDSEPEDEDDQ